LIILGVNAFRADSSAVLLRDGEVIAAVEEERYRRSKHWGGFPAMSIRYCLDAAGIDISTVDHIAINQADVETLISQVSSKLAGHPNLTLILQQIRKSAESEDALELLASEFSDHEVRAELHHVEHQTAHLSSAFHCSPFPSATVVAIDGFGDYSSAAWGHGQGTEIEIEGRIWFPHSLGVFYQALTQFLGFPRYCEDQKVMALAAFGKPKFMEEMRQIVLLDDDGTFCLNLDFFTHDHIQAEGRWQGGHPNIRALYSSALTDLLGDARTPVIPISKRHKDIARSVQAMYEEAFFHLLNHLNGRHGLNALAIGGGCGLNSVANGRIRANTAFDKIYIQAAPGDAGGALGAALTVHHSTAGAARQKMTHAFWGPEFGDQEYETLFKLKKDQLERAGCLIERIDDDQELCNRTVENICNGGVVGWFQGRMEWGPRALGNRSILCDPRRSDMQHILNFKIKRGESFRPFAASVLSEDVSDWVDQEEDTPFMMKALHVRADQREKIPAVMHVDGTCRLQVVKQNSNPVFWNLIDTFRQKTEVPMLLNTSFNENEPIVCMPDEALDCFLRTDMDLLVMGNWFVHRTGR